MLKDELEGIGRAVVYHPTVAEFLDGEIGAALYLQQVSFWTAAEGDDEGWVRAGEARVRAELGMSKKVALRVRKILVRRGVLDERKVGMPMRVEVRLRIDELRAAWADFQRSRGVYVLESPTGSPSSSRSALLAAPDGVSMQRPSVATTRISIREEKRERESASGDLFGGQDPSRERPSGVLRGPLADDLDVRALVDGAADDLSRQEMKAGTVHLVGVLFDAWQRLWRKPRARLTDEKTRAFKRAVARGIKPSEFAKAMVGMTYDPWTERRRNADWKFVVGDKMDEWLDYFDRFGFPDEGESVEMKTVEGHRVPVDYEWSNADTHMARQGIYTFNVKERKWQSTKKAQG